MNIAQVPQAIEQIAAGPSRISIPLVRRIYPQLIANDLIRVQPLQGPASLVFYLRYRYSSNRGSSNRGSRVSEIKQKVNWLKEGF